MLFEPVSHDSLISWRIAIRKRQIMVGLRLFLGKFEQIANSKGELASELCYIGLNR